MSNLTKDQDELARVIQNQRISCEKEVCTCGHVRKCHKDVHLALGHGECLVCDCSQYTYSHEKVDSL